MTAPSATEAYDALAKSYDRRWRRYIAVTTRKTASALALEGGESALDVGCGSGVLLSHLVATRPPLALHGIDPSQEMLAIAQRRCGGRARLQQGAAEALPYPDSRFDVVASASALHFFSDRGQALAEMARVLRPGGLLVLTDWCADFLAMRLYAKWLALRRAPPVALYRLDELQDSLQSLGLAPQSGERFRIRPLWGLMLLQARKPRS